MQRSPYLESMVLTAPPHRLHLLLIEGAIRFGRQAEAALRRDDQPSASSALLRVIDIVGEMLAGVREQRSELNKKIAHLYWFVFRRVSEAKINADAAALAEALSVLEYERETWLKVCEKLGEGRGNSSEVANDVRFGVRAASTVAGERNLSLEA